MDVGEMYLQNMLAVVKTYYKKRNFQEKNIKNKKNGTCVFECLPLNVNVL